MKTIIHEHIIQANTSVETMIIVDKVNGRRQGWWFIRWDGIQEASAMLLQGQCYIASDRLLLKGVIHRVPEDAYDLPKHNIIT